MSKPGSIPWLMAHELRLFWRRGKMRPKSGLILIGLILGGWLLLSFFLFQKIGPLIPPPPFLNGPGDGLALAAIGVMVGFIASVMTSGAILAAVDAIYTRNDLDLLLSSPVSPWRVLVVRSSAIAVGALPLYAGMLGPPLIWMTIFSSPLWLSAIVVLATLAFAATGLALLIVTGLFRLIGPRSTRVLAQIISAVAGATVFLSFQLFNLNSRGTGGMSQDQMTTMIAGLNIDPHVWWLFPARAFTGDIVSTVLWLLGVAMLFPLGVFVFSRSFVADAAAASAMGKRKRGMDARVAQVHGGVMQSVVRKELRLLARDPLLLSQIGLQLIYFIPLAFILIRPDRGIMLTEAAFAPALTLLAGTLAGSLTWITVSAEDAPDLLASAPVQAKTVDRAKFASAVAPVLILMAIPVAILLVRDAWAGLWTAGGVIASAISAALIGLWRRAPGTRREFVRRRAKGTLMAGLGQALVAMGITATAGLGAYGLPWIAILPAIIAAAMLGALYKPAPSAVSAA
jgi:ABC-2 type transport system permease protein